MIADINALTESNIIVVESSSKIELMTEESNSSVILIEDPRQVELFTYGIQGPRGNGILSGSGVPSPALGSDDDLYLDTVSGFLYKKIAGSWVFQVEFVLFSDLSSYISNSFETVSKNLKQYSYSLTYTLGKLSSIVYTVPLIGTITKTFNYTGSLLTSIVLSGNTPPGILLTKTFSYSGSTLTGVSYS